MAITEKENILKFYRHELPDHLPDFSYLHTLHPAKGFLERPIDAEGMTKDWFGVEYIYEATGGASLPDPGKPPLVSDITKWREQVVFPDLDNMDWEAAARLDLIHEVDRESKALSVLVQCGVYERLHALLGMEQALMSFLIEPEETAALIGAIADYKYKLFEKIIQYYKPDILRHHDDYGTQKSMQMSPEVWREFIKPHLARFVELCHKNGVFYEQHSCGLVEPIIPDFVEIGIDSWQGMHINDVPRLKEMSNGKLLFHMSMDIQRYTAEDMAGSIDDERLREDVRSTIITCSEGGNYFPVIAINDANWWGNTVILDEIEKCKKLLTYK